MMAGTIKEVPIAPKRVALDASLEPYWFVATFRS